MNIFNENEFNDMCKRFNIQPYSKEVTINYSNSSFFNKMKKSIEKDRRGEVVFCVIRPSGKIITITCAEYPPEVYRIPTGGIGHNEDIVEAVFREVKEELGLEVKIHKFLGVLKIKFKHENDSAMFYSYLFILKETGGNLLEDAMDDEISEIKEVDVTGLETITDSLLKITGKWADWARFRYETCSAILEYLK